MQSNEAGDPLGLTRVLARSAGGCWIALAPKPLDQIRWQVNRFGSDNSASMTVTDALKQVTKYNYPLSWEDRKRYILLYFGPKQEFDRLKTQPPVEIVGFHASAETAEALLQAIGDLWHIHIGIAPEILHTRSALQQARRDALQAAKSPAQPGLMGETSDDQEESDGSPTLPPRLEFKVVDRLTQDALLDRLADYLGGSCRKTALGEYTIERQTDANQIQGRISSLKMLIDANTGNAGGQFSSFASRQGGAADLNEEPAAIAPLGETAVSAFNGLALLGKPGIKTLGSYLDADRPAPAREAMRALAAMELPDADAALTDFAHKLQQPLQGRPQPLRKVLATELIPLLAYRRSPECIKLLSETALDSAMPLQARTLARMALVAKGDISPFTDAKPVQELPPTDTQFTLKSPHAGQLTSVQATVVPQDAVTPLATKTLPTGETWAVFVSPRYGDPDDLWLARGQSNKWSEFLFTGRQFSRSQQGDNSTALAPGACVLKISGDQVVIAPPNGNPAAEMEKLQSAMQKPDLTPTQRQELNKKYYDLYQRSSGSLQKPVTLSLSALRTDTDNDGLTDLIETRFGLDPKRADTNGNGIPDGKDPNPLAPAIATPNDRNRLLQMIFTALYGKDPSSDPILIVLDAKYWQSFTGARGRVLCVTKERFFDPGAHLSALRALQFGGPSNPESTILNTDGPCLFNDSHTRAEVHFWQWQLQPPAAGRQFRGYSIGAQTEVSANYVARFEKDSQGGWKMTSLVPWKFESAETAAAAGMKRQGQSMYRGFRRY